MGVKFPTKNPDYKALYKIPPLSIFAPFNAKTLDYQRDSQEFVAFTPRSISS